MILELLPEVFQQAEERRRRGLAQGAEGGVHQGLAQALQELQVTGLPLPSQIRVRVFNSCGVPSRQGVHWPQDSWAKKTATERAKSTAQTLSSITSMVPEPKAPPTLAMPKSMGTSRASAVTIPAEAPPVWHILNFLPFFMPPP